MTLSKTMAVASYFPIDAHYKIWKYFIISWEIWVAEMTCELNFIDTYNFHLTLKNYKLVVIVQCNAPRIIHSF